MNNTSWLTPRRVYRVSISLLALCIFVLLGLSVYHPVSGTQTNRRRLI